MKQGIDYLQSDEKRQLDLVAGAGLAVGLAPVSLGVSAIAGFNLKSLDLLFIQSRAGGRGERTFDTYKIRTLAKSPELDPTQGVGAFHPRASRMGRILRQSGLDETPQLLNVLKGEMSLVGPRPLPPADVERRADANPALFDEWYGYFAAVRPGLIGESQIYRHGYRGVTREILSRSMEMDLRYFETADLRQDIGWLGRVPLEMLRANLGIRDSAETVVDKAVEVSGTG